MMMTSQAWAKNNVVMMLSDYDNTWIKKTVPLTYKQALDFVIAMRWNKALDNGEVRIVDITQGESK
jgi:hypothetical protein